MRIETVNESHGSALNGDVFIVLVLTKNVIFFNVGIHDDGI